MAQTFRQDMPPTGGYGPIHLKKAISRLGNRYLAYVIIFGAVQYSVMGYWLMRRSIRIYRSRRIEERGAYLALAPLIHAEQDRRYLRQLLDNRDAEATLMADVPGWKVGALFDTPVYNYDHGTLPLPNMDEFYAHTDPKHMRERQGYNFGNM